VIFLTLISEKFLAQTNFEYYDVAHLSERNEMVIDSFLSANGMTNIKLKLLVSPFDQIKPDLFGEVNGVSDQLFVKNLEVLKTNRASCIFAVLENREVKFGGFVTKDQIYIWPTELLKSKLIEDNFIDSTFCTIELCTGIKATHNKQLNRVFVENTEKKYEGEYVYSYLFTKDFGLQNFGSNNVFFQIIDDSYYVPIQHFDISEYEILTYLEKLDYRDSNKQNCSEDHFNLFEIDYLLIKNKKIIDFGTFNHIEPSN
jgi:hypothetical protein